MNEFAPKFNTSQTQSSVAEDAAVGTTLVTLDDKASDEDVGERVTQLSLPADSSLFDTADVERGVITVKSQPDYESMHEEGNDVVELQVYMRGAGGKTGTGTRTITITDADDLPPVFSACGAGYPESKPEYTVTVPSGYSGLVRDIEPGGDVKARDGDALGYPVTYSITSGPDKPPFSEYMQIVTKTDHGEFIVLQPLAVYRPPLPPTVIQPTEIQLTIQATEQSEARRNATALLVMKVTLDRHTPVSETKRTTILILAATFGTLLINAGKAFPGGQSRPSVSRGQSRQNVSRGQSRQNVSRGQSRPSVSRGQSRPSVSRGQSRPSVSWGQSRQSISKSQSRQSVPRDQSGRHFSRTQLAEDSTVLESSQDHASVSGVDESSVAWESSVIESFMVQR